MNEKYRHYRQRNNAAARKSREKTIREHSNVMWALHHPDLSETERAQVAAFIACDDTKLTERARDVIRKYLVASRSRRNRFYKSRLEILENMKCE